MSLNKIRIYIETSTKIEYRKYTIVLSEHIACVAGAWKQWASERTGARDGDTRRHPFFLGPTTSERLLRRLRTLQKDLGMAFLGAHAALPRPQRLAPCPWRLILVFLINKKGCTVCLSPDILIQVYSILFQGNFRHSVSNVLQIFSYIGIL